MGSSDNLASVGEPVQEAATEQRPCSEFSKPFPMQQGFLEVGCNLIDTNVDNVTEPDGCLGFPCDDNSGCVSPSDGRETFMHAKNAVEGHSENKVGLSVESLVDDEQGGCLNGSEIEIDRFKMEIDQLFLDKQSVDPEAVSEMPRGIRSVMDSPYKDDLIENNDKRDSPAQQITKATINVLAGIENDTCEQSLPSKIHKMPFESTFRAALPTDSVQCYKQKDYNNGLSEKGVLSDVKEKVNLLTEFDKDNSCQLLPSQGREMAQELTSVDKSSRNYDSQYDMSNRYSVMNGVLYMVSKEEMNVPGRMHRILECEDDALCKVEADKCNRTSFSQGGEMPPKSSYMGEVMSNLDLQDHEKADKNVSVLTADNFMDPVETKSNIGTLIQEVPSNTSLRDFEKLHCADLASNSSQKTMQSDNKYVDGLSTQSFTEVLQDKNNDNNNQRAETCMQMLPTEENASTSLEVSLDSGSSLKLDGPDIFGKDVMGFVSSCSTGDCFELTGTERKHNATVDHLSETKCPDAVFSYSRRSSRVSKLSQNAQTKRSLKHCGRVTKVQHSKESSDFIFNAPRQQRSSVSRTARSYNWGLLENITQVFCQSNELVSNQVQNQAAKKSCSRKGCRRQNKNRASGSLQRSSEKIFVSGSCLRFKVKVGKEAGLSTLNIKFPHVLENSSSFNASVNDSGIELYRDAGSRIPKLANNSEDKLEGSEKHFQFSKAPEKAQMAPDQDGSVLDIKDENRNLMGITFSGKSAEDADCIVFASNKVTEASGGAREDQYMDSGTSPDSEVINTIPDAQITARRQEELCTAALSTSRIFDAPAEIMSGKKGKKKGKKKDKPSGSGSFVMEDRSAGTAILNGKQSNNLPGRQKIDSFCHSEILSSSSCAKHSSKTSSSEELSTEPMPLLREVQLGISGEAVKVETCLEAKISCSTGVDRHSTESKSSRDFFSCDESKGFSSSKSKGHCLSKSLKSTKSQRGTVSGEKVYQRKSITKSKVKEKDACYQAMDRVGCDAETGMGIPFTTTLLDRKQERIFFFQIL